MQCAKYVSRDSARIDVILKMRIDASAGCSYEASP